MELNELKNTYQKLPTDAEVSALSDADGFSVFRDYPINSIPFKEGYKMLIKIYLEKEFVIGAVNMVVSSKKTSSGGFAVLDSGKYKFTNFYFGKEENIKFNQDSKKITFESKKNKETFFTNDFIDILVKNHLVNKAFWSIKKQYILRVVFIPILKFLFFLMDTTYSFADYYHEVHSDKKTSHEFNISKDPFFNHFKIFKNMLFLLVLTSLSLLVYVRYFLLIDKGEVTTSNPVLLFLFLFILFILHYLSDFLYRKRSDKRGFIYKMHTYINSWHSHSFKLKLK